MGDTVNGKKIGKGAGKENDTLLTVIDAVTEVEKTSDKILAELENQWNLEAKGQLHRPVMKLLKNKEDYLVFKTKDHMTYVENGKVIKREEVQKDTKRTKQADIEK